MAKTAKVTVHPDFKIGEVDKRLYGAFIEPIGNWVYGGIWNPDHPTADDLGFRKDVIDAVKEFGLTAVRLPGGNWVSGWDWKCSIGPKENRKTQLDLAWFQYEPNLVGHDEYLEWCLRTNTDPIYTINVNSEDLTSAFHLVEYSRHPGGTYWSDLRKKYGHPDPFPIKTWCLGNEVDGSWQIATWEKDPRGYGIRVHEISKIIKWIDNKAETVACGSSLPHNSTYPEWDRVVLEQCYDTVDYLSVHHYHTAPVGDIPNYLNTTSLTEEFLDTVIATCDYVQSKMRSKKKMMISLDEYATMFREQEDVRFGHGGRKEPNDAYRLQPEGERTFKYIDPNKYGERRNIFAQNEMLSSISHASMLMAMLRRADRIKIGIMTGGVRSAIAFDGQHVWKSALYYPYYHMNRYGRGVSLMPFVDGPTFSTPQFALNDRDQYHAYDGVQTIDVAAVHNEEKDEVSIFIVNRDLDEDIEVTLDVRGFEGYKLVEHSEMFTDDMSKANSYENPDAIKPTLNNDTKLDGGKVTAVTKKLSWNLIRLAKK